MGWIHTSPCVVAPRPGRRASMAVRAECPTHAGALIRLRGGDSEVTDEFSHLAELAPRRMPVLDLVAGREAPGTARHRQPSCGSSPSAAGPRGRRCSGRPRSSHGWGRGVRDSAVVTGEDSGSPIHAGAFAHRSTEAAVVLRGRTRIMW